MEGKLFFSILSCCLTKFLENNYIKTSVPKGGISGMPECLAHTGVVNRLLKYAKMNKSNLVVLWVDLRNSCGSIPCQLVKKQSSQ